MLRSVSFGREVKCSTDSQLPREESFRLMLFKDRNNSMLCSEISVIGREQATSFCRPGKAELSLAISSHFDTLLLLKWSRDKEGWEKEGQSL